MQGKQCQNRNNYPACRRAAPFELIPAGRTAVAASAMYSSPAPFVPMPADKPYCSCCTGNCGSKQSSFKVVASCSSFVPVDALTAGRTAPAIYVMIMQATEKYSNVLQQLRLQADRRRPSRSLSAASLSSQWMQQQVSAAAAAAACGQCC